MYKKNSLTIESLRIAEDRMNSITAMETQRLMSRIFFSLNWQDIPEYFEDHIAEWMEQFALYLSYKNPLLVEQHEESEPGSIEKLQAAIIENLNLYATKYEEEFTPYLGQFTQLIWQLLIDMGPQTKYDLLATSSIKFLTSVSSKQCNIGLFTDQTLRDIIQHIVLRNLSSTVADEELFEENPQDYIRKDMEGSDSDTRRRSATELVRGLMKFFPVQVSKYCNEMVEGLLASYAQSGKKDWKAKDTALHLFLACAVMSQSVAVGAGDLNPNCNIPDTFNLHVLSEVQDADVAARPMTKAAALKMVCIFRSHLPAPFLLSLLPHVARHLSAPSSVVQTYAALCCEKFLSIKDRDAATAVQSYRIQKSDIASSIQPLFYGLFHVLEGEDGESNDYVMKAVMRCLMTVTAAEAGPPDSGLVALVLPKLTASLQKVCRNPINPHFNHYLFECYALAIKSVCLNETAAPETVINYCIQFEAALFPPFQLILAQDIAEFVPYVFQILALLLFARPLGTGLSDGYRALFPPLLSPMLWERKGNVPALIDLLRAYIRSGISEIAQGNQLPAVLGIFQKLLASKSTESHAFSLLNTIFVFSNIAFLSAFTPTIFNLLLIRLQEHNKDTSSKSHRYCKQFIHSMCLFSALFGGTVLFETLDKLTPGLPAMLVSQVWGQNRQLCAAVESVEEQQHVIYGATRLLCESPLSGNAEVWGSLLKSVVLVVDSLQVVSSLPSRGAETEEALWVDEEAAAKDFDTTYSKLSCAGVPDYHSGAASLVPMTLPKDAGWVPLASPACRFFLSSLVSQSQQQPGQLRAVVQSALDGTEQGLLQRWLQQALLALH